jgi:hypothetical protein
LTTPHIYHIFPQALTGRPIDKGSDGVIGEVTAQSDLDGASQTAALHLAVRRVEAARVGEENGFARDRSRLRPLMK